jgi:hypothetical protein
MICAWLALVIFLWCANAKAQTTEDHWSFALTPYLWLPNINGTLRFSVPPGAGGSPDVRTGPNNYLENLQAALMISGEARRDKWSIIGDAIYLDFANQKSGVKAVNFGGNVVGTDLNASTSTSLKGSTFTLAGGYAFVQSPRATLDAFGGVRYFGIEASANWQLTASVNGPGPGQVFPASGSFSQRTDLWDAIVGVRGRSRIGESNWFVPYYLDMGTGSSRLTWQGMLGISYAFKWGDAVLVYRQLSYDEGDNKLLQDFRFGGPALGVTFRF